MFELDARLQQDTLIVGDFGLCRLLLMNDARYPWFIMVPRRPDVTEVFHLSTEEQAGLWQEVSRLAEKLKDTFAADKMNLAALGNMVSQLHVHVIVRRHEDVVWPAPVWGQGAAVPYTPEQVQGIRSKLQMVLTEGFDFADGAADA